MLGQIKQVNIFNDMHCPLLPRDRFIPQRSVYPVQKSFALAGCESWSHPHDYSSLLRRHLYDPHNRRLLLDKPVESQSTQDSDIVSEIVDVAHVSPTKMLDLPNYRNDFYTNGADWGADGRLAVALNQEIYLYTPQELVDLARTPHDTYASGIKFYDQLLAVGLSDGRLQLFDLQKRCLLRTLASHTHRLAAIEFTGGVMLTGSKDKQILAHDLRLKSSVVSTFSKHRGEVCSLKAEDQHVFASGSNDNTALVWDLRNMRCAFRIAAHSGAVKALGWCPWKKGVLGTGGGTNDCTLKLWNTHSQALTCSRTVDCQITGLLWNESIRSVVTSHGYSRNEVCFWKMHYDATNVHLTLTKRFTAHRDRVLYLGQSADHNHLFTVGADQTLNFWALTKQLNPFPQTKHHLSVQNHF